MLPLILCLLSVVASLPTKPPSQNYILDIDNDTLKNVQPITNSSSDLNLSGMNLRALEKNAFDNVSDLESLDISNNSLTYSLQDFVFSNLTKLKSLSLSNNKISNIRNLFVGLENLQLLDISHNPIRHLRRGNLFGLAKSVRILTDGNIFWSISTDVFANSFLKNEELKQLMDQESPAEEDEKEAQERIDNAENEEQDISRIISKDTRAKLCKSDGIVTSLEVFQKDEELVEGCVQVPVDTDKKQVNLHEHGISGFQEGWYRLHSLPVASLDLSNNEIAEIREETLNNLPADLTYVNFLGNRIRRIWAQVIKNDHLRELNLKDNLIEEIEEDAFNKTKLRGLYLAGNQLESLNFLSTLPNTLTELIVSGNRITSIPNDTFSGLSHLLYLNLDDNKIEALRDNVFQGLESLQTLTLMRNDIMTVEPAAFKGLTALKTLDLRHNSIGNLQKGVFATLMSLKELNLSWNKILKVTFTDLPRTLNSLYLDYNEIDALEKDSFIQVPRLTLSLIGNRISRIDRGAFQLLTLRDLHLNNNSLSTIDGDSYEGLSQLRRLWLSENKISEIHKGSCKNLGSLYILDISSNPFQKLETGALHGLSTATGSSLYIYDNNLKEMQAGLFDDV